MKLSDDGLYALAVHEGIVPAPYLDSVGVWTYGIGHTAAAGSPDPAKMPRGMPSDIDATIADVFSTFRRDVAKYEAAVNSAVTVQLAQHQFDALVSFHYNTGAIGRASLVKKLNAGDYVGATNGLMDWKKPPEIIERRKAERDLFAHGKYPSGKVTVWGATADGRVIWKPQAQIGKAQFKAMIGNAPLTPRPVDGSKPSETDSKGFWASLLIAIMGILKGR